MPSPGSPTSSSSRPQRRGAQADRAEVEIPAHSFRLTIAPCAEPKISPLPPACVQARGSAYCMGQVCMRVHHPAHREIEPGGTPGTLLARPGRLLSRPQGSRAAPDLLVGRNLSAVSSGVLRIVGSDAALLLILRAPRRARIDVRRAPLVRHVVQARTCTRGQQRDEHHDR